MNLPVLARTRRLPCHAGSHLAQHHPYLSSSWRKHAHHSVALSGQERRQALLKLFTVHEHADVVEGAEVPVCQPPDGCRIALLPAAARRSMFMHEAMKRSHGRQAARHVRRCIGTGAWHEVRPGSAAARVVFGLVAQHAETCRRPQQHRWSFGKLRDVCMADPHRQLCITSAASRARQATAYHIPRQDRCMGVAHHILSLMRASSQDRTA